MDWIDMIRAIAAIEWEAALAAWMADAGDVACWARERRREDLEFADIGGEG